MGEDLLSLLDETMRKKLGTERLIFHARIEVDKHISKKNNWTIRRNRRTGRNYIGPTPELANAEAYLVLQLRSHANHQKIFQPIKCAVQCMYLFKYKNLRSSRGFLSREVSDLDNLFGIVSDSLQKAGILENDKLIHSYDFSRRLPGDKNELEIFIREFTEDLSEPA